MAGAPVTLAMAATGFVTGLGYFALLRHSVGLFAARRGLLLPAALTLGRFAAMILFLFGAAKLGAVPLLAAFLSFLIARAFALNAAKGTP